jgi:hypothetical protein
MMSAMPSIVVVVMVVSFRVGHTIHPCVCAKGLELLDRESEPSGQGEDDEDQED